MLLATKILLFMITFIFFANAVSKEEKQHFTYGTCAMSGLLLVSFLL